MTALRDWSHLVSDVGEPGITRTRSATPEELVELARELDILSCESLTVSYRIAPERAGRFSFTGTLEAEVTQSCVVTLEPVSARLSEPFAVILGPPDALDDEPGTAGDREVSSVPDVEPIEGGRIEAGAVIFGVLSAALDPYPRKEGAAFDWKDPKSQADSGPFSALSKLKPGS